MAAALAGAKAGHDVVLFSGETNGGAAAPLPGGLQIAPNGWAALTQLGLSDAAASCSTQLNSILVRSLGRGTTLIHLPLAGGYASFSRQAMYGLLRDALEAETNIDQIAINIEHINQQTDGLTLVSSDGQSVFCDGLIAAEGGSGPGRRHVTSSGPPDSSGRRVAMRAQINLEHLPAHFARPTSNLWLGSGRHVVHYPLETTLNVVVTMPGEEVSTGWQQRLLGQDAVLAALADPQIIWTKTPLSGAALSRAGGVEGLCLLAMPPTACHPTWHRVRAKALLVQPVLGAGLINQMTRLPSTLPSLAMRVNALPPLTHRSES